MDCWDLSSSGFKNFVANEITRGNVTIYLKLSASGNAVEEGNIHDIEGTKLHFK
jgi:hypothetical protein